MSYNISAWKVKKIKHLSIPISAFSNRSWFENPQIILTNELAKSRVKVCGYAEMFEIDGVLDGDHILVDEIESGGEGSGTFHKALLNVLEQSGGELEVLVVWEGGDTIERLTVKDGLIEEIPYD